MSVTSLDTRRSKVLQAVVEVYIETALPVSSQQITKALRWQFSPATIRNIMAELDELGFIWQPHTSAGRIPTDYAYRYYIDSLLEQKSLSAKEKDFVAEHAPDEYKEFNQLLTEVLRMLSSVSGYTALAFSSMGQQRFFVERISYILEQPEFQSTVKLKQIFKGFEEEEPLIAIMRRDLNPDGIKVHIGKENSCEYIQECSLVISNFKVKNNNTGALGIIGPRRMAYAKTISAVDHMARLLDEWSSSFDW